MSCTGGSHNPSQLLDSIGKMSIHNYEKNWEEKRQWLYNTISD